MAAPAPKKLTQELNQRSDEDSLRSPAGAALLREALSSREPALIAQAAQLIAQYALPDYDELLVTALNGLRSERAKVDAGCLARVALLSALDATEHHDAEPFAEAARYEQRERMKGGVRDTGAPVRARGILGLARLGHRDLLPLLGAALGDADGTVRLSAARALGHRGLRDGAGLLLLRLAAGESEPEVRAECLRALFATAPDLAARKVSALLREEEGEARELTLNALGSAPHDAAVELLIAELQQHALAEQRRPIIAALGLSLRPRARAHLLSLLDGERDTDGEAALSALAIHRYDARLVEQLRAATAGSLVLSRAFHQRFEG